MNKKRQTIEIVKLFLLVFFIFFGQVVVSQNKAGDKTNIVIINIDDMGWRDVGFMGSKYYETPNIDKLSEQGMIFTNAYASAANCAPSRACLMTGKWTARHGIYTVGSSKRGKSKHRKLIPVENTVTLSKEHVIFPEVLQKNGYVTCHSGKWHLSNDPKEYGFDVNIGGGHNGHPKSYYPPYGNVKLIAENWEYLTDLIIDKTIEFVDSVRQPFLLYYSPYAVHTPIHAVDSLKSRYENKAEWNGQNNVGYATMIDNLDRNIGRLISALRKNKLFENTFIVFTSDNGGLYGITKQLPLRAGKGSYYEGGIRVPFFFVWKGKVKPNTKNNIPITNLDIFPTLMKLAGMDSQKNSFDGQNLLPVLKGKKQKAKRPLFWHFPIYLQAYNIQNNQNSDSLFRIRPGSVVRYGKWKLHHYFENNGIELYNLKKDISETNNLAKKNPEKAKELLEMLDKWREETNAPIPTKLNSDYKL